MIGRSVANRPNINIPLNNGTYNNIGTGGESVTNSGCSFTTGIFGESNGAITVNNPNYIYMNSTVGQRIAGYINGNGTFLMYFNSTDFASQVQAPFHQWGSPTTSQAYYTYINPATSLYSYTGVGQSSSVPSPALATNTWHQIAYRFKNKTIGYYANGSLLSEHSLSYTTPTNKTANVTFGGVDWFTGYSVKGKINNIRFYSESLPSGAISILNNEKGRIRA